MQNSQLLLTVLLNTTVQNFLKITFFEQQIGDDYFADKKGIFGITLHL